MTLHTEKKTHVIASTCTVRIFNAGHTTQPWTDNHILLTLSTVTHQKPLAF